MTGTFDDRWESDIYSRGRLLNRYPFHEVITFLMRHAPADRASVGVLELGCGAGNNSLFVAREGMRAHAIDGSESAIRTARERFAEAGLDGDIRVGDFAGLPWPDASFDFVFDRLSLTCSNRAGITAALDETRRVLKPGGRLMSMIYSTEHGDRRFGRPMGDGTYADFAEGYFAGLPMTFFASPEDVDDLYAARFVLEEKVLTVETDLLAGKPAAARWRLVGRREAD